MFVFRFGKSLLFRNEVILSCKQVFHLNIFKCLYLLFITSEDNTATMSIKLSSKLK